MTPGTWSSGSSSDRRRSTPSRRCPSQTKVSPSTLAKRLRQLGACLQAAKTERLISENPVRLLASSAKPKAQKKRPSYFTDDELGRLWPELADRPLMSYLCRLAVATGCGSVSLPRFAGAT
jgi:integrase